MYMINYWCEAYGNVKHNTQIAVYQNVILYVFDSSTFIYQGVEDHASGIRQIFSGPHGPLKIIRGTRE